LSDERDPPTHPMNQQQPILGTNECEYIIRENDKINNILYKMSNIV